MTVVCRRDNSSMSSNEFDRIEVKPQEWTNTRYTTDPETATIHEEQIGSFVQIPLRLAWAITIHKSQGLTFDRAIINAGRAFSHGQVYVALSRCRTLDGLILATPISSDIITTDPDVIQFTSYADQRTPTAETFLRDRRSFLEDILCEIFDFRAISMRLRYFERLTTEHLSAYFPSYVRLVAASATQVDNQLMAVGVKFQAQIRQLMAADNSGKSGLLRERLHKAMTYYATTTASILGELFANDLPEVDNARTREQITNEHSILRTAYEEKMSIYTSCLNEFSLDAYWNAKAKAAMIEEPKPKRKPRVAKVQEPKTERTRKTRPTKAVIDYERVRNVTLYRALLDWRNQTARERKLPIGYIMAIHTIIGIANLQPRTPDELLTIPGIGKKTVQDYGADLLEIVAKHAK